MKNIYDRFLRKKESKNFLNYVNKLMIFTVCICILLSGIIYFVVITQKELKKVNEESRSNLELIRSNLEAALSKVEADSLRFLNNQSITNSLINSGRGMDVESKLDIYNLVTYIRANDFLINEVCYYSRYLGGVYQAQNGYVPFEQSKYSRLISRCLESNTNTGWMEVSDESFPHSLVYLRKLPVSSGTADGVVLIFLDYLKLEGLLSSQTNFVNNQVRYILDSKGNIILKSSDDPEDSIKMSPEMVGRILELEDRNVDFEVNSGNIKLHYTVAGNKFGRIYVSVVPLKEIYNRTIWVMWTTVFITLFMACCGIILSIINSKRIYLPIKQLIRYSMALSKDETA